MSCPRSIAPSVPTTAGVGRQPPRPLRSPAEPREGQGNRVNQRNRLDAPLQQRLGAVPEIGDDLSGLAELLRALALALPFDNRALLSGEIGRPSCRDRSER